MRQFWISALALVVAACAGSGNVQFNRPADEAWLFGWWLTLENVSDENVSDLDYLRSDRSRCETDVVILYESDGDYHMLGESGRWSLKHGVLTQAMTELGDVYEADGMIGKAISANVARVNNDEGLITYPDGMTVTMLRCP